MLDSVFNFGSLPVIESVESAYEVSGDSSDSLEPDALTDHAIHILYLVVIHMTSVSLHNNSRHFRTGQRNSFYSVLLLEHDRAVAGSIPYLVEFIIYRLVVSCRLLVLEIELHI